jgi:protein phosphatase
VCQVEDQYRGGSVQCGGCGRQFAVPAPSPSWLAGVRKVFQSLTGSVVPAAHDEPSLTLELDGPAAHAMEPPDAKEVAVVVPRFEIGCATSTGPVRPRNEDSYLVQQWSSCNRDDRADVAVLVVADGMGGHASGDVASGLVIRSLASSLGALGSRLAIPDPANPSPTPVDVAGAVSEAIQSANRAAHRRAQSEASCEGMGAALAVVVAWNDQVVVAHVGDCRVYQIRAGKLLQLTRDHTVVERMVELGKITLAEAQSHPARNELTQAMGRHPQVEPSTQSLTIAGGDWLIVACDGLPTHVDDAVLAGMTAAAVNAPQLASDLVALANKNGGSDNCTVLVLRCRAAA